MRLLLVILLAQRTYWPVNLGDYAKNGTAHTHISVTGRVGLVKRESDGDLHIKLVDPKTLRFIVAECIPIRPCTKPAVGSTITVQGISRFDGEHKWWEVHPVEAIIH